MAGIGLYGVYYSKATLNSDGVLQSYGGVQTMGKAISATFEPVDTNSNPLYANNGIAEKDAAGGAGGGIHLGNAVGLSFGSLRSRYRPLFESVVS